MMSSWADSDSKSALSSTSLTYLETNFLFLRGQSLLRCPGLLQLKHFPFCLAEVVVLAIAVAVLMPPVELLLVLPYLVNLVERTLVRAV